MHGGDVSVGSEGGVNPGEDTGASTAIELQAGPIPNADQYGPNRDVDG